MLFDSYALTGNRTLVEIATSHADRTLLNHVRPDGSSFHVVEYNATRRRVIKQVTAQGYSDNSTWNRGQAWGIHGLANGAFLGLLLWGNQFFAYCLRVPKMSYLETSRKMASYFLDNIPPDDIVPWRTRCLSM